MKIALVCIAKNEDNYIKEWITYHKKLGFDDIFIYENDLDTIIKNDQAFDSFILSVVGQRMLNESNTCQFFRIQPIDICVCVSRIS